MLAASSAGRRLFIRLYYLVGPSLACHVERGLVRVSPIRRLLDVVARADAGADKEENRG